MKTHCRCHGVSGACSTKTCSKKLAGFHEIAALLKRKYMEAVEVQKQTKQDSNGIDSQANAYSGSFRQVENGGRRNNRRRQNKNGNQEQQNKQTTEKEKEKEYLVRKDRSHVPINDYELVYTVPSFPYCRRNRQKGFSGTRGRECVQPSTSPSPSASASSERIYQPSYGFQGIGMDLQIPGSCDSLCCGREVTVREEDKSYQCQCKFIYCCQLQCKTCRETHRRYFCDWLSLARIRPLKIK